MGTSVQVMPLSGVHSESPLSYVLSVDGFNFLVDCGWNDFFDVQQLQPLAKVVSSVDAVLISHPDTSHIGALAYAVKRLGLSAPIYATEPVHRLGILTMYDHYLSRRSISDFDIFTLDDIDAAFQNVTRLTYSQNYYLTGKGQGIIITPYAAGRLLGGTIWKVSKDGEDVIYAVDFNHRKERHLNGTVLDTFVRPAVLITDAFNALNNQPSRRQRDQEFLDTIVKVLRADGNVLLPVNTAGRVLELLLCLEQYWTQNHLTYTIAFLTNVASSTIDYVKSFLEWMSDSIAKSFEHNRDNAFQLKYINVVLGKKDLEKMPAGPKVVLASMSSLESGFSRDIFVEWATDPRNAIIFTERGQFGTVARILQTEPPPKAVKITLSKRVPLTGDELKAYEEEQNRLRMEDAMRASNIKEEDTDPSYAGGDAGPDLMNIDSSVGIVSKEGNSHRHRNVYCDGFVPSPSSVAPMFPLYENANEWDDYGEVINPDDFIMKTDDIAGPHDFQTVPEVEGKDKEAEDILEDTIPTKVVLNEITVQIKCSLSYFDFEGRSDGRSIKSIIGHVSPLKLVLVHGSAEATEHLKQHCLKHVTKHVYAPQIEETVDVTSDLSAYKVQLSEKLMSTVLFKKLGDYELSWIDGQVGKNSDMLTLLPLTKDPSPHSSVNVGDLRLADFKQLLVSKGLQAEFVGGQLRCGDYITVRKIADSAQKSGVHQIVIEGPLTEEYYKIREYLYSQFYVL